MVKECIDTLYNARIAGTAGVSMGAFSTNVVSAGHALERATLAQEVALAFYEVRRRERLGLRMGDDLGVTEISSEDLPPTFDLVIRNGIDSAPEAVTKTFEQLRKKIGDAYEILFELRGKQDFIRSARELQASLDRGEGSYLSLLESHTRLVARALAGLLSVESQSGWFKAGITTGSSALGSVLGAALTHSWLLSATAAALSAGAGDIYEEARRTLKSIGRKDRVARAMAHVVQVVGRDSAE
jgi:hypothetical protein